MTEDWKNDPVVEPPVMEGWEADPVVVEGASEAPTNKGGASSKWRLAVSMAEKPEDQLATLRNLQKQAGVQPDAQWVRYGKTPGEYLSKQTGAPYQVKEEPLTAMVYTNPETGERELFDPQGFNIEDIPGDLAEMLMPLARMLAYGGGAVTGYVGSGGPANPSAPMIGHAAGVGASQAVNYGAEPLVEAATGVDIPDTRGTGERMMEGLADVGLEASLPIMGGTTARAGAKLARAPARAAKFRPKGMGHPETLRSLERMALEQGENPDEAIRGAAALVTDSPTVQGFFQALRNYPKAADTMKGRIEKTLGIIRKGFTRAHGTAGGVKEKATAGERIQEGLGRWGDARRAEQEQLENQVERIIGSRTQVRAENTETFIREQLAQVADARHSGGMAVPKEYRQILKDIEENEGHLAFQTLRMLRRKIGQKGGRGMPLPGHASAEEMDALYGVMSEDLGNVATATGGKARKFWQGAQQNWHTLKAKEEKLRAIINAKEPELAFRAAMSGTRDGPTRLKALLEVLDTEERDALVSAKLWEMGTTAATTGARGETAMVFHPTKFIREWRAMPDSVKNTLFPGASRIRNELSRLAEVTAREEGAQAMVNVSGTAQANVFMEMLGDSGFSQMVGADISAAQARMRAMQAMNPWNRARRARRQAKLMTDPDFVRWLANGSKITSKDPARVSEHLGRLGGLAASKPEIRGDVEGYLEDWDAMLGGNQAEEQ